MRRKNQRGLTLVELIVAFTIILLLTTMAVPMARFRIRREREKQLNYALHEMRQAINKFKDASDARQIPPGKIDTDGYPESLEQILGVLLIFTRESLETCFHIGQVCARRDILLDSNNDLFQAI